MRNLPGLKPTLRLLARGATNALAIRGHVIPRHSAFFRGQKKRHTHDSFSVCSVVSDGFRLKTPLLNNRTRNLRGLKPTLRLLARAIRGHVIPRFSAFFRGQKRLNAKTCAELQTALPELLTAILGGRSSR